MVRSGLGRSALRRSGSGSSGSGSVNSIIAGTNVTISSTGPGGTGDVTINSTATTSVRLSALTAANATNSIQNTQYQQTWLWNALSAGSGTGMLLQSATTVLPTRTINVLQVDTRGDGNSQNIISLYATAVSTNSGYNAAIQIDAQNSAGVNYAIFVENGLIYTGLAGVAFSNGVGSAAVTLKYGSGISTTYKLPPAGTSGQFLTLTDNVGTMNWGTPGGGISGLTATRIPYAASATTIADDAALYWDNTNKRLSVGEGATPPSLLSLRLTDATTNAIATIRTTNHTSSGTTAIGFGSEDLWRLKLAAGAITDAAAVRFFWNNVSTGSASYAVGLQSLIGGVPAHGSEQLRMDNFGNLVLSDPINGSGLGSVTVKAITLTGSTSGALTIAAPATAGSASYTWPGADGTSGYFLSTDGAGVLSWAAGGGGGSTAWSALTDPAGNLALNGAGFATAWTSNTAFTNVPIDVWTWTHSTSGTAAAGFGISQTYILENGSGTTKNASKFATSWVTATAASERSKYTISLISGGTLPAGGSEQFVFNGGTSSATSTLTLTGALILPDASGSTAGVGFVTTGDGLYGGSGYTGIMIGGNIQVQVTSARIAVQSGVTTSFPNGTVSACSIRNTANANTGIYFGNTQVNLAVGGNTLFSVNATQVSFFGGSLASKQGGSSTFTNNVTPGGTAWTIADYTDLVIYANDAATIRNDLFVLSDSVANLYTSLRAYNLIA